MAIALGVLVVGTLIVAEVLDRASGCGSVDPTAAANYSGVRIVNDRLTKIVISNCRGAYCDPDLPAVSLAPNGHFDGDAACGETGSDMTSWQITGARGELLGYVAVRGLRSQTRVVFHASLLSRQRDVPTPSG